MFTICVSQRASCQRGLAQNQNESINNVIWTKCLKRVYVAKADSLFLFVRGAHGRKSFMESINVESGPNVIAGLKCKVQNNKKKYKKRRQVLRQL